MEVEAVARRVLDIVTSADIGTVVTVRQDGSIVTERPGSSGPAWERRQQALAVFIVTMQPLGEMEVRRRIEQGLRKLQG